MVTILPEPDLVATTDLSALLWMDVEPILRDVPEPLDTALRTLFKQIIPLMAAAADGNGHWSDQATARIRTSIAELAKATDDVTSVVGVVNELTSRVLYAVMSGHTVESARSPRTVSEMGSRLVAELLTGVHHATTRRNRGTLADVKSQRTHELLKGMHADACDDYDLAPAYAVVAVHSDTPVGHTTTIATFEHVAGHGALTALGTAGGFALLPAGDEVDAAQLTRKVHAELPGRVWLSASWRPRGEITWGRQEASKVLSLVLAADYEPGVYQLDDILVEYAVAREPTVSKNLVQVVAPLLDHPALFDTLKMLVTTDGNRSQAAERLIIHRSTLDYRIQRIGQLTGLHPGSVRGINVLSAAVTAYAVAAQAEDKISRPAKAHIHRNT